ncbi:RIP metalloprotease RseP [Candidatus Cardinium hertigii]|uniref:Zinc metalloprotease n=1 Tax=Candidatus Cardinium hertigii TaxID=247481 RepID=A0A2Z3LHC8_9BACT|nr:RIP metalloprotease RseP [Candidatus Cardinium hertigii]AWN81844.1 Putative zinc metalloprotease [Candidatus Cardinium hertigii]
MASVLIQVIQFLAGLSLIVGIHELGHLFFAKLFKMRVNSYIIGFPPKIFKIRYGETEYAIGSIPLGGAVHIAGMLDESCPSTPAADLPQPWEFRSKPAWQRLIVILGGIIFNLLSSLLIYIGLCYAMGYHFLSKDSVNQYGIMPNAVGVQMGFKPGDKVIKINGKDFENFHDIYTAAISLHASSYYTVCRAGQTLELPIIPERFMALAKEETVGFIRPMQPCIIASVDSHSSAELSGLMAGDQIVKLADQDIFDCAQLMEVLPSFLGKSVSILYMRKGYPMATSLTIDAKTKRLGIGIAPPALTYIKQSYSLLQAIPVGLQQATTVMQQQLWGMWKIVTGKLSIKKSLGGPISLATMFERTFVWHRFLTLVAMLSIVIGLTNAFPLPVLDGGHALFILYEMLFRKKVPDRVIQLTQQIGWVLLVLIMLYVCGNDTYKLFA